MSTHEHTQNPLAFPAAGAGGNGTGRQRLTMSSREIADLVGKGDRHDNVKRTIETLANRGAISHPQIEDRPFTDAQGKRRLESVLLVGKRDSYVIVAQLSPEFTAKLVDRWQELEARVAQPFAIPTTAEALAHTFRMLADQEREQAAQGRAIAHLEEKVERVETAQTVLSSRPANAEAITHLRERIGKRFGLSAAVVDAVMRQSPYTPKPAGVVRNDRAEAEGATYTVYWKKDITALFSRFASECQQVTATMFTHPFVEGRFRMAGKGGAA